MHIIVSMQADGLIVATTTQGQILAECFFKAEDEGALPLSEGGLSGHSEKLCGRSEGVVSGLDHQLPFLEHVHQFDTNQSRLRRVKRFEPQHGPCYPLDCSIILLHDIPTVCPSVASRNLLLYQCFQSASRIDRPFRGGEKMTPAWAQRQAELLRDCLVSPDVFHHMVDRLSEFAVPYVRRDS